MTQPVIRNASAVVDPTFAHRIADATLTVRGPDGRPLAGAEVTVAQRRHRFLFGCIGFDFIALANEETEGTWPFFGGAPAELAPTLADAWFELFNFATLPFYWGGFEPERGRPETRRLLRTAQWFAERGAVVKGHPLAWHTANVDWLLDGDPTVDELVEAHRARITREVRDFAGVVDMWDVINEAVIMPVFDKYDNSMTRIARHFGRIGTIRMTFDAAREANPRATLLLNDFDMSSAYECLLEGVLEAGIQVDVLGLQSHMHQGYWGEDRTLAVLERFSRYGLPIHMTENTILSGHIMPGEIEDLNDYVIPSWPSTPEGEARQADEIARHYRTLLAHPAVEAITYWGITDAGSWLGAPVGFLRADGSRKPSFDALRDLVKGAWWVAPTVLRTDDAGRVRVSGWLGEYDVSAAGVSATVSFDAAGPLALEVTLA